jgi:peptidoglycan/LPS O-acetylase OafA/YrhL
VGVLLCLLVCVAVGVLCYLAVERPLMRLFHNWYKQLPFSTDRGPRDSIEATSSILR